MMRSKVTLVAECKWTNKSLDRGIVTDLETYKIPALRDAGFKIADPLRIVLFSKAGYGRSLCELANADSRIELIEVPAELGAADRHRGSAADNRLTTAHPAPPTTTTI